MNNLVQTANQLCQLEKSYSKSLEDFVDAVWISLEQRGSPLVMEEIHFQMLEKASRFKTDLATLLWTYRSAAGKPHHTSMINISIYVFSKYKCIKRWPSKLTCSWLSVYLFFSLKKLCFKTCSITLGKCKVGRNWIQY